MSVTAAPGKLLTHVELQKLLYFAHALHLIQRGRPLLSGNFEAWPRGPVHPAVYQAFKTSGANPIRTRAAAKDPFTDVPWHIRREL